MAGESFFDVEQLHAKIKRLTRDRDTLLEVVTMVEWEDGIIGVQCPWCEAWKENGHANRCPRQDAIALCQVPSPTKSE